MIEHNFDFVHFVNKTYENFETVTISKLSNTHYNNCVATGADVWNNKTRLVEQQRNNNLKTNSWKKKPPDNRKNRVEWKWKFAIVELDKLFQKKKKEKDIRFNAKVNGFHLVTDTVRVYSILCIDHYIFY